MPPLNLLRGFTALWVVTGAVLLIASLTTMRDALSAAPSPDVHLALLATIEAISAVLFLVPRTMRAGAAGLLGTLIIAFGLHATTGQFRGELLLFGAAVAFVAIHGPLTRSQWRATLSRPTA